MGRLITRLALGIATVLVIIVLEPLRSGDEAHASMILAMTAGLLVALAA
jgi:hypothetical protein